MVDEKKDEKTVMVTSEISSEQLSKELSVAAKAASENQEKVANELLQVKEEEAMLKTLTNPSAIALTTTEPDAGAGVGRVKKTVRQLFILYLTNQFVSRAINVRADTLISRGFNVIGPDEEGVQACLDLIENSGGINLFWQLSVNTDIAGDGFLEKIYNKKKTKILELKHIHPLTLRYKTDETTGKIITDENGNPEGYTQLATGEDGVEIEKDVPLDAITHLRYNTLGDEFTGISTIQPGYNTIVRLMNMEFSAATAAIKTANPLIIGVANTKSPHQIAQWGQILGRISGQEQIFVPEGMEIKMLSPGEQNFSKYAEYFLNAVVSTFGVPKGVLLGDSGGLSGNRAEGVILSRHFYSLISSLQKYQEDFFNKIFKEYAKIGNFVAPKLVFDDLAEDSALNAESTIKLYESGLVSLQEAREMIGLETPNLSGSENKPIVSGMERELDKSDRITKFPASPGKAAGSQKGIKKQQKRDPFSTVKPNSK